MLKISSYGRGTLGVLALVCLAGCRDPQLNSSATASQAASTSSAGGSSAVAREVSSSTVDTTTSTRGIEDCRPGTTRTCREREDGTPVAFPDGVVQGSCRVGGQTCGADLRWGPCTGVVAPQPADGCVDADKDANCNGTPFEGCACVVGVDPVRPCGSSVGNCETGLQACVSGVWGRCEGETKPIPERCDGRGLDEDCDGLADMADPDCECLENTAPTLCRISGMKGDCALGSMRCLDGRLTACTPRFAKSAEICGDARRDSLGPATGDEDCDGAKEDADGPLEPINCTMYMMDIDNDGWGAIGESFIKAGTQATYGCFCGHPTDEQLGGRDFVIAKDRSRANADCGDCYGGEMVFPGQTKFFAQSSACLEGIGWKGGPFDYNCDESEERRYSGIRIGDCLKAPGSTNESRDCVWSSDSEGHWLEGVAPACGKDGLVPKCRLSKASNAERWGCTKFMLPAYVDTQLCR